MNNDRVFAEEARPSTEACVEGRVFEPLQQLRRRSRVGGASRRSTPARSRSRVVSGGAQKVSTPPAPWRPVRGNVVRRRGALPHRRSPNPSRRCARDQFQLIEIILERLQRHDCRRSTRRSTASPARPEFDLDARPRRKRSPHESPAASSVYALVSRAGKRMQGRSPAAGGAGALNLVERSSSASPS